MKKAILAKKIGMTQIFADDGSLIPVTVLSAGPCVVTQVKTKDSDGYSAVQVGFDDKREKLVGKPMKGIFDKAGVSCKRFIKELKFENAEEYKPGQEIKADIFAVGDHIDATAISKGKGFQGAIHRLGQSRGQVWPTAPNSTVIRVPTELLLIRAEFTRERECPDIWAASASRSRTLRLSA